MHANPAIGVTPRSLPHAGAGDWSGDPCAVGARLGPGAGRLDVAAIRADFPALGQEVRPGVPFVYLDCAATSLKPWPVIRAVQDDDANYPASVHRGLHTLSERATQAYEWARVRVERFKCGLLAWRVLQRALPARGESAARGPSTRPSTS